jgi:hypothetical protein
MADKGKAEAKTEYYKNIEALQRRHDEAGKKLHELKSANDEAWDDLKTALEKVWDEVMTADRSYIKFRTKRCFRGDYSLIFLPKRSLNLTEFRRLQDKAAQGMKNLRHVNGALSFETVEARPVFDGDEIRDLEVERQVRKSAAAMLLEQRIRGSMPSLPSQLKKAHGPGFSLYLLKGGWNMGLRALMSAT